MFAFAGRKDGNVEEEEDQRVIWETGANSVPEIGALQADEDKKKKKCVL